MRFIAAILIACLLAGCQPRAANAAPTLGPLPSDTRQYAFSDLNKAFSDVQRDDALDPLVMQYLGGKWRITGAPVAAITKDQSGGSARPCIVVGTRVASAPVVYFFVCDPSTQNFVDNILVGSTYDFEGSGASVAFHQTLNGSVSGLYQTVIRLQPTRCAPSP